MIPTSVEGIKRSIVIFLAYFEPQLRELDWFRGKDDPIPLQWVVGGCLITAVGIALVYLSKRPSETRQVLKTEALSAG